MTELAFGGSFEQHCRLGGMDVGEGVVGDLLVAFDLGDAFQDFRAEICI